MLFTTLSVYIINISLNADIEQLPEPKYEQH